MTLFSSTRIQGRSSLSDGNIRLVTHIPTQLNLVILISCSWKRVNPRLARSQCPQPRSHARIYEGALGCYGRCKMDQAPRDLGKTQLQLEDLTEGRWNAPLIHCSPSTDTKKCVLSIPSNWFWPFGSARRVFWEILRSWSPSTLQGQMPMRRTSLVPLHCIVLCGMRALKR